ncbi:hypothetical protein [Vibrio sp. 10N.261.52.A1]|uniref:hypothetical protein n=1 Tax=Vibrio TaxID=662 RepID=UPI000152F577|nr:hypothetical protein [Vibrio sp. 10N.261.52.A1]EDK28756.1 hypothetical protein VSWAT3_16310 [Vibrionales bacterium SWAT-3]PML37875.1 hypothetical protein BCT81_18040 [Vibrio sp. 10N.261.52.A1]
MIDTLTISHAINSAMNSTRIEPKYRVFQQHSLDYIACSNIVHRWGTCLGEPQEHLNALYGSGFCLALNEITKWSLPLTLQVFDYINANGLLISYDCPKLVDVYIFLTSSSNWTPFGIHQDFEDSHIIDVAGFGRDLYLWEEKPPFKPKIANSERFTGIHLDYKPLLPSAKRLSLKPGQHYNVRQGVMHIFHALGPGVFIGLSCKESGSAKDHAYIPPMYDPNIISNLDTLLGRTLTWLSYTCHENTLITDFGKVKLEADELIVLNTLSCQLNKPLLANNWLQDILQRRLLAKLIKVGALHAI